MSARVLPVARRDGSVGRSAARGGGRDAFGRGRLRLPLLTGCRMSDIRDLRREHVKDGCIERPDAETGGRAVPLGPEARAVPAGGSHEDDNPWVMAGGLPGSHLTVLQRPRRRIRARVGLQDVRHSFASRVPTLGESLTMIGKLLDHTQVQTAARYVHLARDSIRNAAPRITRRESRGYRRSEFFEQRRVNERPDPTRLRALSPPTRFSVERERLV